MTNLSLEPIGTFAGTANETPVPIVYRVIGTKPIDSIHIERVGETDFEWCVVWYRLEGDRWNRMAFAPRYATAEDALKGIEAALADPDAGPISASASAN